MNKNYKISLMLMLALALGTGGTANAETAEQMKAEVSRSMKSSEKFDSEVITKKLQAMNFGKLGLGLEKYKDYSSIVEKIKLMGFIFVDKANRKDNNAFYSDEGIVNKLNDLDIKTELADVIAKTEALNGTISSISTDVLAGKNGAALKTILGLVKRQPEESVANLEAVNKELAAFGTSIEPYSGITPLLDAVSKLQKKIDESKGGVVIEANQLIKMQSAFLALPKKVKHLEDNTPSFTAKVSISDPKAGGIATVNAADLIGKMVSALSSKILDPTLDLLKVKAAKDITISAADANEMARMSNLLARVNAARAMDSVELLVKVKGSITKQLDAQKALVNTTNLADLIEGGVDAGTKTAFSAKTGTATTAINAYFSDWNKAPGCLYASTGQGLTPELIQDLLNIDPVTVVGDSLPFMLKNGALSSEILANVTTLGMGSYKAQYTSLVVNVAKIVTMPLDNSEAKKAKTFTSNPVFAASDDKVAPGFLSTLDNKASNFSTPDAVKESLAVIDSGIVKVIKTRVDTGNLGAALVAQYQDTLSKVLDKLKRCETKMAKFSGSTTALEGSIAGIRKTIDSIQENEKYKSMAVSVVKPSETISKPETITKPDSTITKEEKKSKKEEQKDEETETATNEDISDTTSENFEYIDIPQNEDDLPSRLVGNVVARKPQTAAKITNRQPPRPAPQQSAGKGVATSPTKRNWKK